MHGRVTLSLSHDWLITAGISDSSPNQIKLNGLIGTILGGEKKRRKTVHM